MVGDVTMGDECIVGAHAVLTKDLPGRRHGIGDSARQFIRTKAGKPILSWQVSALAIAPMCGIAGYTG